MKIEWKAEVDNLGNGDEWWESGASRKESSTAHAGGAHISGGIKSCHKYVERQAAS